MIAASYATDDPDFQTAGFTVLRAAFSPAEAHRLRQHVEQLSRAGSRAQVPHPLLNRWQGVTLDRELWDVIFHAPLVQAARRLLGTNVRYAHNSEVHANNAGYLWHRDSLDQTAGVGPDWDDSVTPYRLLRACIHLQSFAESGAMFGVVPGSHLTGRPTVAGWATDTYQQLRYRLRLGAARRDRRRRARPMITMDEGWLARWRPATPTWVRLEPGDCVLLHQRVVHSASNVHGPQYAIYFAYGPDDLHTQRQWQHYRHQRPDRPQHALPHDLARRLAAADLLLAADRAEAATAL